MFKSCAVFCTTVSLKKQRDIAFMLHNKAKDGGKIIISASLWFQNIVSEKKKLGRRKKSHQLKLFLIQKMVL